jgi:hypothetical protein
MNNYIKQNGPGSWGFEGYSDIEAKKNNVSNQVSEINREFTTRRSERASAPSAPAGWYADPQGQARLRWWDGTTWTQSTSP